MYSTCWLASELCSTMKVFKAGQTLEPRLPLRFTFVPDILWCRRSQLQQACTGSFSRSLIVRACLTIVLLNSVGLSSCIISRLLITGVRPPVETLSWWFFNRAQMANAFCRRVRTGSAPKSHRSLKFLHVAILVLNLARTLHRSFMTIFVLPLSSRVTIKSCDSQALLSVFHFWYVAYA